MKMPNEIDELTRGDHFYLTDQDECYFFGEYTPREGFQYSETNSFILNLKKPMERRGMNDWGHKGRAIAKAAQLIRGGFKEQWLKEAVLVPVPPSKIASNPAYDDRMLQVLRRINPGENLDVRELVRQTVDREAMHLLDDRYKPADLIRMWEIDESYAAPAPTSIAVFDDVLTSGTHFRAMKSILQNRFSGIEVIGIFLARVVRPSESFDLSTLFGLSQN